MLIFSMAVVSPFVISFFLKDLYHCWSLQPPLFFISLYTLYTALPIWGRFLAPAFGMFGITPSAKAAGAGGPSGTRRIVILPQEWTMTYGSGRRQSVLSTPITSTGTTFTFGIMRGE